MWCSTRVRQCTRVGSVFLGVGQAYHFSAIPGNLEMSGNSAKDRGKKLVKRHKVGEKSRSGQWICVVRDIWFWHLASAWMDTCSEVNLPVLYFNAFCNIWCSAVWVDFSQLLKRAPRFVTSRICINKCAIVRYVVCNFVWKSRGFFSVWRVVILMTWYNKV